MHRLNVQVQDVVVTVHGFISSRFHSSEGLYVLVCKAGGEIICVYINQ